MGSTNKLQLNTILKLSIITLAFAGVYYFISSAQLKNNNINNPGTTSGLSASDEITWKQKCQQIGEDYFKTLQEKWPPSYDQHYNGFVALRNEDILPQFAYNSSLNTCLISYKLLGYGPGASYIQGPQTPASEDQAASKWGFETQYFIDDTITKQVIYRWTDDSEAIPPRKNDGTYYDWSAREQALMVNNSK